VPNTCTIRVPHLSKRHSFTLFIHLFPDRIPLRPGFVTDFVMNCLAWPYVGTSIPESRMAGVLDKTSSGHI
jgi:hypothetical protein